MIVYLIFLQKKVEPFSKIYFHAWISFTFCALLGKVISPVTFLGATAELIKSGNFDKVIVATGGVSYPRTGACDSGYRFAESAGHSVVKAQPSLVPFEVKEKWCRDLMGVSLKNVGMSIFVKDDKYKSKAESKLEEKV